MSSFGITKSQKMTYRGRANSDLWQARIGQAPVSHLPWFEDAVRWLSGVWPIPACRKLELVRPWQMSTTARTSTIASSCFLCCCRPNSCQCYHNSKKPGSPYSHLIGTNEPSLAPQFKWLENTSKLIAGVMDTGDNCSTDVIDTVDLFIASIYSTDYKWISRTRCNCWCRRGIII